MKVKTTILFLAFGLTSCSIFRLSQTPGDAAYEETTVAKTFVNGEVDQEVKSVRFLDSDYNEIQLTPSDTVTEWLSVNSSSDYRAMAKIHKGDTLERVDYYYSDIGLLVQRLIIEHGDTAERLKYSYDAEQRLKQVEAFDDGQYYVSIIYDYKPSGELLRKSVYTPYEMVRYIETYVSEAKDVRKTYWSTEDGERGILHTTQEDIGRGLTKTTYHFNSGARWQAGIYFNHTKGDYVLEKRNRRGDLEWVRGYSSAGELEYEIEVERAALKETLLN